MTAIRLAVFASGNGTNALNIHQYFRRHEKIRLAKIYVNSASAGVISKAIEFDIPYHIFTHQEMLNGSLLDKLKHDRIHTIALAGFLRKIPVSIIAEFEDRIYNLHPSLLPAFGGKGMYGIKVHEAVIRSGDQKSGISIHKVSSEYDKGDIVFQKELLLDQEETPASLAERIHMLEYEFYPKILEEELLSDQ
jgi:phosphoribosylglycinamide formyltransferase-1